MAQSLMSYVSNLTDPQSYVCDVLKYQKSHSLLSVYAKEWGQLDSDNNFYIVFASVIYFEGPIYWSGVNFYLGSQDECVELLDNIGPGYSRGFHNRIPTLFKVDMGKVTIKIVAERATIGKEHPWF